MQRATSDGTRYRVMPKVLAAVKVTRTKGATSGMIVTLRRHNSTTPATATGTIR